MLQHVGDIIAAKPAAVWLQTGIRNAQAEDAFAKAGMKATLHPTLHPCHSCCRPRAKSNETAAE